MFKKISAYELKATEVQIERMRESDDLVTMDHPELEGAIVIDIAQGNGEDYELASILQIHSTLVPVGVIVVEPKDKVVC